MSKAARNERRKAFATTCNALAVAFFISAFLQPLLSGRPNFVAMISALLAFVVLQSGLHYVLGQVED
ncbi:hypothetical protein [Caulobacter sp. 1776]|uniref:hypothetical protein n=1 Tax=Caulobacter sp. 1776 TaxID=3156420 RepID=UPI0033910362